MDHAVVDEVGVQTWHGFDGFALPEAYVTPPMMHSARHAPPAQTSPAPQLVPVAAFDHAPVDDDGAQTRQAFAGSAAPAE